MEEDSLLSMRDVDATVTSFLRERQTGLVSLHKIYFKNNGTDLSYRALVEEMTEELKTGCVSFINKNSTLEGVDSYLFYIANAFCKKHSVPKVKKSVEYVCPGCLVLGKQNLIYYQQYFTCDSCKSEYDNAHDAKWKSFFEVFKKHSKNGWRCCDCDRFIPDPLIKSDTIVCPYLDCCFVGNISLLKKMGHPSSSSNPEKVSLDLKKDGFKSVSDILISDQKDALTVLSNKEELDFKVKTLLSVIDNQSNAIYWNNVNFTVKHKIFVYQAFKKLITENPEEMIDYLLHNSRSGGFQHKIFQEYVSILENNLPMPVKKGKNIIRIESLLDENLGIFDGISTFEAVVDEQQRIKNQTKEFYIGGRKGSYAEPYFIGKLLNVINTDTQEPILHKVKEYSFSKIKLKDINPGTNVNIVHLRIPPHYQMGGMVYVNRIRKKIVEKAKVLIDKNV